MESMFVIPYLLIQGTMRRTTAGARATDPVVPERRPLMPAASATYDAPRAANAR
jgi:hypothetical protein